MNIITTELEYQRTFYIVPQVTVRLGKSWCVTLNWDLEDVCQANLDKLASRKERGVIDGEGDNR